MVRAFLTRRVFSSHVKDEASRLDAATEAKKSQLKALIGEYVRRAEGANARVQALEAELAEER